jgi:hypothetical protein
MSPCVKTQSPKIVPPIVEKITQDILSNKNIASLKKQNCDKKVFYEQM